ncbi:MAG: glycoside hydrolase family 2 TIM barrel-domain containing protein [Gemmatimonadaceae bacterium]
MSTKWRRLSRLCVLGLALLPASVSRAQTGVAGPRVKISLNDGWRFYPDGLSFAERTATADTGWQQVSVPHTWNVTDPFDDVQGYRRGVAWYRRRLDLPDSLRGRRLYLQFEGVNQVARVYVNGAFAGEHKGGYTAFTIEITDHVRFDTIGRGNLVAVQVDNSHDPSIAPLSVGFALYGGIYRDVWLIATAPVHFSMDDHGSSGVAVSTPAVSERSGVVRIEATVTNELPVSRRVLVRNTLTDASGSTVAGDKSEIVLAAGDRALVSRLLPAVANPKLWSPSSPYLYSLTTEILAEDGTPLDRISGNVGFRWFRFAPDSGFFLNGSRLLIKGTNRHQDRAGFGSALSDSQHVSDLRWIKDMGANFVRLAHYPQDPSVLDAADRLGLLVWEEIPVVNYITPSAEFARNSRTMLLEMIRQHRNHPSVVLWGTMNEVFLWSPQGARIGRQNDTSYMRQVRDFARSMDSLARAEDPSRLTAMAIHGSNDYDISGVAEVPQVLGINIYSGWYSGRFEDLGAGLDRRHAAMPDRVIFVSEYGAEDDERVNSLHPARFDFSGTWMRLFHESYLRQMNARPWLGGTAIWSQFDFSQPETGGSIPYMNQKGMLTWDRRPKDFFYLYKANWNPAPTVYIASRGWTRRTGTKLDAAPGAGPSPVTQPVSVYSNLPSVELFANGRSLGIKVPDDVKHATWDVPFVHGNNTLEARGAVRGQVYADRLEIAFTYRPPFLADPSVVFEQLAVNVGGSAQVAGRDGLVWEGDQPYVHGSFGYVGGEPRMFDKDLAITASPDTPLYFTYQLGIANYVMDVPDGEYEIELHFAEPEAKPGERVFDVTVNDRVVERSLDLATRFGIARAGAISATVTADQGRGIRIGFAASKGKPILNAIRVRRR